MLLSRNMASATEPVVAALIRTDAAPDGVPGTIVFTKKVPSATMGRLENNEVVLDDLKVSKVHARVLLKSHRRRGTEDGMGVLRLFIKDTSSFGTHVNGCKLATERWTMLVEDDVIGLKQPQCYADSKCQGEYRVQYKFPPMYLELNLSRSKRDADSVEAICTNAAGAKRAKLEVPSKDLGAQLYRGIIMQLCPQVGQTVNLVLPDGRLLEGPVCDLSVDALLSAESAADTTRRSADPAPNAAKADVSEAGTSSPPVHDPPSENNCVTKEAAEIDASKPSGDEDLAEADAADYSLDEDVAANKEVDAVGAATDNVAELPEVTPASADAAAPGIASGDNSVSPTGAPEDV